MTGVHFSSDTRSQVSTQQHIQKYFKITRQLLFDNFINGFSTIYFIPSIFVKSNLKQDRIYNFVPYFEFLKHKFQNL